MRKRVYRLFAFGLLGAALLVAVGCPKTTPLSSAKAITAFSFQGYDSSPGTIDETQGTIAVTLPIGTAKTGLIAVFTTTGASVTVAGTAQVSGTTANDFTSAVTYHVTAQDGGTKDYVVSVTAALASSKAITAFNFLGLENNAGTIDEAQGTISVSLLIGISKANHGRQCRGGRDVSGLRHHRQRLHQPRDVHGHGGGRFHQGLRRDGELANSPPDPGQRHNTRRESSGKRRRHGKRGEV